MKYRGLVSRVALFTALSLTAAAPVFSDEIEDRLKSLKQEMAELEARQIELKKEATAQAAAMPAFSYRPGNGMMIEAADKSWSLRAGIETHFRYLFESGRDQVGRSQGELMGRRFRPYMNYCINNCLWEMEAILDLDGFGTGNAWNNTRTGAASILHRGAVNFHGENLNPWLPTVQFGMDVSSSIGTARQGSSAVGAQAEYDLLSNNNGFGDGRSGQGFVMNWDNKPLDGVGIPGRINRLQFAMAAVGEGDDGTQSFTDRKDFVAYVGIEPFSQIKNMWLSGLKFEMGSWFCNVDARQGGTTQNACGALNIQDLGNSGKQTLFASGAIGDGLATFLMPGITWEIGPYTLRAAGGFQRYGDRGVSTGRKTGDMFLIGHDLFVWSPKGFLTGSAGTTGSVLIGSHFERTDVACTNRARCSSINGGQFHRDRILLREWDMFYFVAPRMSIGTHVLWYDASNLQNGFNQAGNNLGLCRRIAPTSTTTNCRAGFGGDWVDVMLNFRYTF